MKTATMPALRGEPELRLAAEEILRPGETLSAFVEDSLRRNVALRRNQQEFITRGIASLNAAQESGEYVSAKTLAQEACRIEIEILMHPIGKQDQYAAAYGGFNHIRFNSDESVLVNPVIMREEFKEELNRNLMLFYTGMNSRSDTVLTEQKLKTKENRHVLDKMVEMAEELKKSIEQEDTSRFASILNEGWIHKKKTGKQRVKLGYRRVL